jgi:hypothetical protein
MLQQQQQQPGAVGALPYRSTPLSCRKLMQHRQQQQLLQGWHRLRQLVLLLQRNVLQLSSANGSGKQMMQRK